MALSFTMLLATGVILVLCVVLLLFIVMIPASDEYPVWMLDSHGVWRGGNRHKAPGAGFLLLRERIFGTKYVHLNHRAEVTLTEYAPSQRRREIGRFVFPLLGQVGGLVELIHGYAPSWSLMVKRLAPRRLPHHKMVHKRVQLFGGQAEFQWCRDEPDGGALLFREFGQRFRRRLVRNGFIHYDPMSPTDEQFNRDNHATKIARESAVAKAEQTQRESKPMVAKVQPRIFSDGHRNGLMCTRWFGYDFPYTANDLFILWFPPSIPALTISTSAPAPPLPTNPSLPTQPFSEPLP